MANMSWKVEVLQDLFHAWQLDWVGPANRSLGEASRCDRLRGTEFHMGVFGESVGSSCQSIESKRRMANKARIPVFVLLYLLCFVTRKIEEGEGSLWLSKSELFFFQGSTSRTGSISVTVTCERVKMPPSIMESLSGFQLS